MRIWVLAGLIAMAGCVNRAQLGVDGALLVSPQAVAADGNSFATVSVLVISSGVPIAPDTQLTLLSNKPTANIVQFGPQDANGWRYGQISSGVSGTQTLTVMATGNAKPQELPFAALVTFNPLAPPPQQPSPYLSSLTANPNLVADDGQTVTTLVLHVVDGNGLAVPAATVTFTSTGSNNFFSLPSGFTDLAGVLTTTLASTTPELKTVTAHVGSMAVSTQVTFSPQGASPSSSTLLANPNIVTADGASHTILTLGVRDALGLPLPGAPVSWASTGGNNTLVASGAITDANGEATATLASTTAEVKTITATSGAMQRSQQVTFVAGAPSTLLTTFVANPNWVVADHSTVSELTFTLRDGYGNPVPNAAVTFSVTGSNNNLTPLNTVTNASGVASATLVSGTAETKTVTAVSATISLNQTVTFFAGAPSQTTSTITASPNVVAADGVSTSTITVTLLDNFNNAVVGQAVTFSALNAGCTFSAPTGTTNTAGQVSTTVTSTTAATSTIVAAYTAGSVSTEVTFLAGAPSSTMTTLSAAPTTLTADGVSTTTLTVIVEDAYGNPVGSQAVGLTSTGLNNAFSAPSGTTTLSGEFTATMSSATAEVKTITVTAGSATATATVTFVAGTPSSTTTTFVANPTSLTADGASQSTLTVTVEDAQGNPVANQNVTIVSTGSNNTLAPGSGTTNSSGVFTATLSSTKAEAKNLTATAGGVNKTASVTFVAGAPSALTTTLVANPNVVTANNSSTTTLTFKLLDAQGNPIANQGVSLSSTGSNNNFGNPTGTTNSIGVYTTTMASSTAEVKTVTATVGSMHTTTPVSFVAGPPTSANCTLSANPTSVTADGNSTTQLTLVVRDAFGNPVVNQLVSLSSNGSSNVFTPSTGATNSSGQFVATLASTKAEVKTITGTAGSATAATNVTFVHGPLDSLTTTFVVNPNSLAADGSSAATLVTTALDANGNPVPGQTVSLSASGGNNTFTPGSGSTDGNGIFSATLSSTTVQSETVTSLVAGLFSLNANITFTTPVVNVTNSTIVASPNTLTADGSATTAITVTVRNGSNAPVVGASVVMSATGTANVFSNPSGSTDGSGVFSTTLASTQAALKVITATVDGTALNTNVTFLPGTPVVTTTTFVASPNTVTADGVSSSTLTLVVEDSKGNPVPNQNVTLAASGGNNTLTPTAGATDATGRFTATLASTLAQTENVTATVHGFTETATVVFVPGTVSGVTTTFVANPNTTTADGSSTLTLTATVRDAEGNPVPNQSVVLSGTGSNNTFSPPSGSTNSAGVFTATMTSSKAEAKTVKATIGTVTQNANVVFVAGPVSGLTSTLVLNPTSVTANGNTTTVTVTVQDANGNLIANQNVALSGSGTANIFTPQSGPTNGSGVFTATLSSTTAQVETITATVGAAHLTAAMTFTAGSPNSTTSTLTASPTTLVANGVAITTLTVTVKDAQGNPVPSQAVSLGSNGTSNTITPNAGTTNSSGVFTATFSSTTAQIKLVTATIGTVTKTANVTFTPGPATNANTTFTVNPTTVTADGTSTCTVTVTVEDQYGNPINNQGVTFSSNGTGNTFAPAASGTTNASGVFSATLSSTVAQVKSLTATVASLAPTATVTFTAGAPANTTSSVSVSPSVVTADGTSTTTVTVTVKDTYGNLVANQAVSVGASGVSNIWSAVSGTSGTTNASGVWTTTLASTHAQPETITATIGTVTETTSVSFVAGAATSGTSSLTASPNTLADDGVTTTTIQISVEDKNGNPLSGQSVTFSSSPSTGTTFSAATCTTTGSGLCSVTLKSSAAGTVTVTANFAGVSANTSVTFLTGSPSNTSSVLTASPNSLADDGVAASTLQITVKDATGNPVNAQVVTFSSLPTTGTTFSAATCNTSTLGSCSVTLKSTVAEAVTVTAAFAGLSKNAGVTFVLGSPNTTASTLTASPTSLAANGSATSLLTVTLKDATGNAIPSQAVTFTSTDVGDAFSATTGSTNSVGVFTATVSSTKAQADVITVSFAGLSLNANITFTAGAPSSSKSTLVASPNTLIANGSATSSLIVTVEDAFGNPVSGQSVTFAATGTNNSQSAPTASSNTLGVASVTLASTKAQVDQITVTFAGITLNANVTFVVGPPSIVTSNLTATPNAVVANGTSTSSLALVVLDANGNPVTGQTVTIAGTNDTFGATSGTTSATGTWSTTVSSSTAGASTITATVLGVNITTTVTFTAPGSFNTVSTNTTITTPTGMLSGDFNDDGNQDVLISNSTTTVYVYRGVGNGNFLAPLTYTASAATNSVTAADFNLDGYTDFAAVATGATTAYMYLNNQSGSFTSATYMTAPITGSFYAVSWCYFDAGPTYPDDSYPDLVAPILYDFGTEHGAMWGVNNHSGGAATTGYTYTPLYAVQNYATAYDFATDGNAELVVRGGNDLFIFNDHAGNVPTHYTLSSNGNMMVIGDVDYDGHQDILVATSPISILYYQSGGTTFALNTASNITGNLLWIVTDDLNADHHADAIMSTNTGAVVGLGTATRGTMTLRTFTTGHPAAAAVAADFNNDGVPDIATVNSDNGAITVMLVAGY